MYSKLPNLIIGFHGCDASVHDAILYHGEKFKPSKNDYDWLGSGVYFWEQNYERALMWAKEQEKRGEIQAPAVLGAVIDLGYCLNLTDSRFIDLLKNEYELLKYDLELAGGLLPINSGKTEDKLFRRLDCAVIEHLHARIDQRRSVEDDDYFEPFDSVRGLFSEANEVYPGAGFNEKTHVQICVRNPNCIKGIFEPRRQDRNWRIP